ncbi:hypothetical protein CDN99_16250 [Roseateles aquatilis]|uniref:Uncharacterized protein n=1 Tax=Roseateles aquatilis TaxID=431061 RepID=A0A246J7A5_9BURK|nr:hypothetical protein [Roseateles aquatilis]OWQ88409.1 hypothetical protein CDN99_16250 [Roseateles aquatilis]
MSAVLPSPGLGGHAAVLGVTWRKLRRLWWLLLPLAGITALATMRSASAAFVTFFIAAAIGLQFVWWSAATALAGQNHPLAARLVPGQVRQLRETAVALFLLLAVLGGLAMHQVMGDALAWTMVAGAAMLVFAAALRWPALWILMWLVPSVLLSLLRGTVAWQMFLGMMTDWHQRQPIVQTALVMIALCALLWRTFQDGGTAHARHWTAARQLREVMMTNGGAKGGWPDGRLGMALKRFFQWGRPFWFDHLLRTARPTADSVAARAEVATLRGLHWSVYGSSSAMVLGALLLGEAVLLLVVEPGRASQAIQGALPGVSIGLMSSLMGPLFGIGGTLYQTRHEQALLLLVPGMPRGPSLNRVLARRQLGHYLAMWAVGVGMMTLMWALAPEAAEGASRKALIGLHFAAVALPCGVLMWRDWSRQGAPSGQHVALMTLGMLVLMGLSAMASVMMEFSPWWPVAGSAILTVALVAWRWPALRDMVPFWPVGRDA